VTAAASGAVEPSTVLVFISVGGYDGGGVAGGRVGQALDGDLLGDVPQLAKGCQAEDVGAGLGQGDGGFGMSGQSEGRCCACGRGDYAPEGCGGVGARELVGGGQTP
jgi:hypothetical protein